MNVLSLSADPTLSSIIGSTAGPSLLKEINDNLQSSNFFGTAKDIFAESRTVLMERCIAPLINVSNELYDLTKSLLNKEDTRGIIPLDSLDLFRDIPKSMFGILLSYEPIRQLHSDGIINGFGMQPFHEVDDNPHYRIANQGRTDDACKTHYLTEIFYSTDPIITMEEKEALYATYNFIDNMLKNSLFDPTDYPNKRC